ncbi:hypothetical protein Nepgr_003420 [Nepenthes gracilis]|uniref:Uncharacterized protein n=1 Tax=Nepenthes gracilis TaxID=150966 RepID=A0AAD3RZG9_NEPGR|nr:hypothetical protein Nepgr_003420 [Nepenthes gracilis]
MKGSFPSLSRVPFRRSSSTAVWAESRAGRVASFWILPTRVIQCQQEEKDQEHHRRKQEEQPRRRQGSEEDRQCKETVKATSSIADLGLKHWMTEPYDINQEAAFVVFLTAAINRVAPDHGRGVMHRCKGNCCCLYTREGDGKRGKDTEFVRTEVDCVEKGQRERGGRRFNAKRTLKGRIPYGVTG